ncbi:VacJ family lipoprotein [Acinetobacter sp.]|uniref:MlaA family lipoprotein n=1 Tax=Acinetobacter sp. TaxID=472 RepID=UPI0035B0EFBE
MRHTSFLYAGLLSFAVTAPAFANTEPAAEAEDSTESANTSKTQQFKQAAIAKSSEVAKKLSVNANAAQSDAEKDPFESFNRKIFAFNETLDTYIARPLAVQYVEKVPEDVRGSYRQFRKNLNEPWNAANQLIQGRPARAAKSLGRFTINTLTTLGFADPARRLNLSSESEGFGITMGYFGIPSGPYIVLPVLGPSTIREGVGLAVDSQARPQKYLLDDHEGAYWSEQVLRGIDARSQLLELENVLQGDKYAQIRDFYLQRISFAVTEKKGIAEENLFINTDDEDDNSSDEMAPDNSDDQPSTEENGSNSEETITE